jgi:hypothetical protein
MRCRHPSGGAHPLTKRVAALGATVAVLAFPAVARANGDPASDYLLVQKLFLPFTTKIDQTEVKRLNAVLTAADRDNFKIRVAVILSPSDLGTAFSLYRKPQRYAEFLGLELAFVYRGRLLVVMPNGYGYSVGGKPNAAGGRVVKTLPPPGQDATKQVEGASEAIRKLAAASGRQLPASGGGGGGSKTRDRITVAAGAVALAAGLAAIVFWRRERRRETPTTGV